MKIEWKLKNGTAQWNDTCNQLTISVPLEYFSGAVLGECVLYRLPYEELIEIISGIDQDSTTYELERILETHKIKGEIITEHKVLFFDIGREIVIEGLYYHNTNNLDLVQGKDDKVFLEMNLTMSSEDWHELKNTKFKKIKDVYKVLSSFNEN